MNSIPSLTSPVNPKFCTNYLNPKDLEELKNQARDVLAWAWRDPDIVGAGNIEIAKLTTKEEVEKYMDSLIDESEKPAISLMGNEVALRLQALDKCDWLTSKQRKKIKITEEYIEINGIKLKLHDEKGEDVEGRMFRGDIQPNTLTNEEWGIILNLIGSEPSQQYQFFHNVLGMKKPHYVTGTVKDDDRYFNENVLTIDPIDGVTITEEFSEGPENWTWGRFKFEG